MPPTSSAAPPAAPAAVPPVPPLALPLARHAERLPPGVGAEQVQRLQRAAYCLPQVVTPGDLGHEVHGAEQQLDDLGLVLLQKAAAGQRPSRWIAPALMPAALQHLDALPATPQSRAQMLARTGALEALGLQRRAVRWERLCTQPLAVAAPGWSITLNWRAPVDDAAVWAFYRDGDKAALRDALGAPPPCPWAGEIAAHIDHLWARSAAYSTQLLDTLLSRLQAECATPQSPQALKAACTRAQDRWEHRVTELDALAGLTRELAFQGYPDSFDLARRMNRQVHLYVGPPNSGKTHAAFERLKQVFDGAYLAPLRLLALEGRDRLVAQGVPCSLLTGEENVPAEGARVVSSTIEMVGTRTALDVAVIDEAQMLFDASRGWAWTQAIVGVPARELVIICSAYAVPAIENLLRLCGETCTVRHFERKQHVDVLPAPVPLAALRRGDAVVAFSRRDVLTLRDRIATSGHSVSVIYGALPPEVRRREAERFAAGETDVLVATDAIGMGLNLPIRRVLFSTLTKFDGQADRTLDESEVHQIAGRAGRFGIHEEGHAGVLGEAEPDALRVLKQLLARTPKAPRDFKAFVAPNWWHVDTIASRLHKQRLHEVLHVFMEQLTLDSAHFEVAELEQMLELAQELDHVALALPLRERFIYAQAPVDTRAHQQVQAYLEWAAQHARTGRAGTPWFLQEVDEHSRLERMEQALRACTLWLWLDLRFPQVFGHLDEVLDLRERLNDGIQRQLKGKRPLARERARVRR